MPSQPKAVADAAVSPSTAPTTATLIQKTPGVCGGSACLGKSRIAVWLVVDKFLGGATYDDLLAAYPHITRQHLRAALEHFAERPEEIAREIYENTDETFLEELSASSDISVAS